MNTDYLNILQTKTPPRSAIRSSYIQKCVSFGSTKKGLSFEGPSMQEITLFSDEGEPSTVNDDIAITCEVSNGGTFNESTKSVFSTTLILQADDPGLQYTDSLFEEFLDFFLTYSGHHEIFTLLLQYEQLCSQRIEDLSKIVVKSASAETKFHKTIKMLRSLEEERNTWRLIRTLFEDRLECVNVNENEMMMDTMGKRLSDKQIVDNLYLRDSYIRQCQLIVDWLEKNAADYFHSKFYNKFEYFADNCYSWEHTLSGQVGLPKSKPSRGQLVVEMDPDAPLRNRNDIRHDADKENEARLYKYMFICMRSGDLDQAQRLADRFGEPWMAAALEGWRLHHDPNFDNRMGKEGEKMLDVEGNKYRDIWKVACWGISNQSAVPIYEQAMYGALSGNLKAMLSVCATWDDHLWAYVRALLDKRIEQELRSSTQQDRILEDLPPEYWDKDLDLEKIFQELPASHLDAVKADCMMPLHIVQKYVILDDLDGLIEEMYNWLKTDHKPDAHILRCMVHIILFLRVIGKTDKEELCIPILEAYVLELIRSRKITLIAPYTSTLPKELQIIWYAKFLEEITDNTERQKCLQYAEDAGLDVPQIAKTVVKNIREKESEIVRIEPVSELTVVTTQEDQQKIDSIDWLIFDPSQRAEAMKQANALMRIFLTQRKVDATKQLFSKLPEDSIGIIIKLSKMKDLPELSADEDNTVREYLCFKAYLEAMEAFNNWFYHSVHSKPKEPHMPNSDDVTFKEKVAYEHEVQQYDKDLERWKKVATSLGSMASDCLFNVLLFVNGGWMVDQRTDGEVDDNRQRQLSCIRKQCIPQVTRLLQDLLLREERYKEAVQLADVIASERHQLYKEFTHEELQNYLQAVLEPSFRLLDEKLDPFGYPNE